ncbi:MAG: 30S ribosomal protein S14 [Proteobacteria bacterium]|nr:30S ribosomal protein S14 [Pseudomonadota bacterium]MDA0951902.1 30S ribosomal protein S14 [Pseudomonadota bacterium]MDA1070922.1 30S ribosomal protein S14 [Pseudomonadota bacterium]
MAKKSAIEKNEKRKRLVKQYAAKRAALLEVANDRDRPMEERFQARLRLAALPRNSAKVRVRNRCGVTGRPRGYHRKFNMSRVSLRELASDGLIPGVVKSSW